MDFMGEAGFYGGNVRPTTVPESSGSVGYDHSVPLAGGLTDHEAIWATEDDYRALNGGTSSETPSSKSSFYDGRSSQIRSGISPPNKKSRNSQGPVDSQVTSTNRSKEIGKMFFKTKLCCKFRAGVCPYITNCNFAHGIEELRKPPPNWQEVVAAHEEEYSGAAIVAVEPREEHQIPTFTSSDLRGESQRSYKGRHCKKFYTDEGCPYGENCTYLHDEQSRDRECVAISLSPTVGGGYGGNNSGNESNQKPSNWKTRICNKWETTGYCPFGIKCHFAHGVGELHKFGGGYGEGEGKDSSSAPPESWLVGLSLKTTEAPVALALTAPHHMDVYHMGQGVLAQRTSGMARRPLEKWKGPDKISRIYGDWIDDID